MLTRFAIRILSARPEPAKTGNPVLDRIAKISHLAFYVLVAGMIATGLATALLADLPSIVFGGSGAPLPESFSVFPTRVVHGVLAKALVTLIAVHATAALFHTRFGDRNQLLHFEKNLAMAGGFLVLLAHGSGAWAIDAWRRRR